MCLLVTETKEGQSSEEIIEHCILSDLKEGGQGILVKYWGIEN